MGLRLATGLGPGPGTGCTVHIAAPENGTGYSKNLLPGTGPSGEMGSEPMCPLSLSLCSVINT